MCTDCVAITAPVNHHSVYECRFKRHRIPISPIEIHSQLYAKMRTILIKHIWHLRCFSHLAPTTQPFSA